MADQFRDQVNTARRAGYSDEEIAGYLIEKGRPSNRVTQALDAGYKPAEILQYLAPALSMGEEAVRKVRVGMRGVTKALAPVTAGAAAGATAGALLGAPTGLGAPIGALAGGLAVPVTDALVMGYNRLADSNVRLPSQVISSMLPGPTSVSTG